MCNSLSPSLHNQNLVVSVIPFEHTLLAFYVEMWSIIVIIVNWLPWEFVVTSVECMSSVYARVIRCLLRAQKGSGDARKGKVGFFSLYGRKKCWYCIHTHVHTH